MNDRQKKIMEILKQKKITSIDTLCSILFCSSSTIRRDLITLENIRFLKLEKGKVTLIESSSREKNYQLRNCENVQSKKDIALLTTDFIKNGMSIFLDSSSTSLQICSILESFKELSVITNGIEIAHELIKNPEVDLFVIGGYVRPGSSSIIGEPAIDYGSQFNVDLCILSCSGLDQKGLYEASLQQASIKKCMLENSKTKILLADHSKFNNSYKFKLCGYNAIDYLLTDLPPTATIIEATKKSNCEILY